MVFEARRRHGNEWRSLTGAAIEPNCPNAQRSLLKGSSSDESARSSLRFEVREAYPPQVPSEIAGGSKCRGHGRAQEDQGEALAIGSGTLISGVSMPFHALFHPVSLCFLHFSSNSAEILFSTCLVMLIVPVAQVVLARSIAVLRATRG